MALQPPVDLLGAPGSPYSRKMVALLRYRRISYMLNWGSHHDLPMGYPETKIKLLPTFYFREPNGSYARKLVMA